MVAAKYLPSGEYLHSLTGSPRYLYANSPKMVPVKLACDRLAFDSQASFSLTLERSAFSRFVWSRMAPVRFAPWSLTPLRSFPENAMRAVFKIVAAFADAVVRFKEPVREFNMISNNLSSRLLFCPNKGFSIFCDIKFSIAWESTISFCSRLEMLKSSSDSSFKTLIATKYS